jgi:4-amino-4-deoxy-L-arabinose transferase-like glycosyltransferase
VAKLRAFFTFRKVPLVFLSILLVALALRVAVFLVAAPHPERFLTDDSSGYITLAQNLNASYWDPTSEFLALGLKRPPVYPLFLAVWGQVGALPWSAILSQILLDEGILILTFLLLCPLVGTRPALTALVILALDLAVVQQSNLLLSDTLFTFLVVASALGLWKGLRSGRFAFSAAGGLLLGLGVLTRPVGLYLPIVLLPASWYLGRHLNRRQHLGVLMAFALSFLLIVGTWVGRNYALTGVPIVSTIEGTDLLYYRAASALADSQGLDFVRNPEVRRVILTQLHTQASQLYPPGANPAQRSRAESALGLQILLNHPIGTLKTALRGLVLQVLPHVRSRGISPLFTQLGLPSPSVGDTLIEFTVTGLYALFLLLICIAALYGSYRLAHQRWSSFLLLVGLLGYFAIISAGPAADVRYRVPYMPYLAALAGYGLTQLWPNQNRVF